MKTLADRATREAFRRAVAEIAKGEIGAHEDPPGSNRTRYGRWYGMDGSQWCAMYVSWVYSMAAMRVGCENPLAGIQSPKGFARCTTTFPRAKKWGIVLGPNEPLMLGDVFIWSKGILGRLVGANGHTGVVTAVHADGSVTVTEGNTNPAFSRTGGNVMSHAHTRTDGKHGHLLAVYRPTRRYGR